MIKKSLVLILSFSLVFMGACSGIIEDGEDTVSVDIVTVQNVVQRTVRSGASVDPYVTVTVKNSGTDKVYNLAIDVTALSGGGNVVSGPHTVSVLDFSSSSDLDVSSDLAFEVEFTGLSSHDDYATLRFDFDWEVKKSGQISSQQALLY